MPSQYELIKSTLKGRQTGIFVIISTDNVDTYILLTNGVDIFKNIQYNIST